MIFIFVSVIIPWCFLAMLATSPLLLHLISWTWNKDTAFYTVLSSKVHRSTTSCKRCTCVTMYAKHVSWLMWLDMWTHAATLKFHNLSKFRTHCIKRPTVYEMKKYTGWNNKQIGHQIKYSWTSEQSSSKLFKMKHKKDWKKMNIS